MNTTKTVGIIAEYNPFHNGHAYLTDYARAKGHTHCAVVMSGNFAQRAEPTITSWQFRTHAALLCGVDLVLLLPVAYATASAAYFATRAVETLYHTGCINTLLFASETGEIEPLQNISQLLYQTDTIPQIKDRMEQGLSFAAARTRLVAEQLDTPHAELLQSPNNLLGIEYLLAAKRLSWPVKALTVARVGTQHDSATPRGQYASASLLRHKPAVENLAPFVPPAALEQYNAAQKAGWYPFDYVEFEQYAFHKLRQMKPEQLRALPDCSEGIENHLFYAIKTAKNLPQVYQNATNKRYPRSRIRRLVLAATLGITAKHRDTPPPYLHIAGATEQGRKLLHTMKQTATLPFSHRLLTLATHSASAASLTALEANAYDCYSGFLPQVQPLGQIYAQPAIFIP